MALRHDDQSFSIPQTSERPELRLLEGAGQGDAAMEVETSGLFVNALTRTVGSAVRSPARAFTAVKGLAGGLAATTTGAASRAVGRKVDGPVSLGRDKRFADPTWDDNAVYWALRQAYLLNERFVHEILDSAPMDERTKEKAGFLAQLVMDAMAPTNFVVGNPAVLKRAFETGGMSLLKGLRTFLHDLATNEGWPSQVDHTPFEVGETVAATPGRVVFRNDLIELIQYEPRTEMVHEVPLLFCPPWINKYYIMDLAPGRSLIEWAVEHGHTCFAISFKNPDEELRGAGFDQYLMDGPLKAIEVVQSITGSEVVNTLSVCLGGTLSAMGMALDAAQGRTTVNTATMINTHTDFTRPGVLGAFTDEATIAALERHLSSGSLSSRHMGRTFSLLRANELVFNYVVSNWLMGDQPPAFDLLAWNDDGTDMPSRLHADFLRSCYLENRFAEGRFEVDGTTLDPKAVQQPTYVVSAVDDHIVPWESAYQTTQLFGGDDNRFVLSTSGHIAAIVNPPSPKAKHWTNTVLPADAADWKAHAQLNDGTWWEDWAGWISERSGELVPAPTRLGGDDHPALGSAPGTYVLA
jgi:polyhydroxyalkanoate synthase